MASTQIVAGLHAAALRRTGDEVLATSVGAGAAAEVISTSLEEAVVIVATCGVEEAAFLVVVVVFLVVVVGFFVEVDFLTTAFLGAALILPVVTGVTALEDVADVFLAFGLATTGAFFLMLGMVDDRHFAVLSYTIVSAWFG